MIQNAPGCTYHHMRAVLQTLLLTTQSHTATQRHHFDVGCGARQSAYFYGDLIGEFARRAQHQSLHRVKVGGELFNQGQTEGCSLAAAGTGLGNHILPGKC